MKKIKQLLLIAICAIGTFFSSSSIYAIPPKFTPETDELLIKAVATIIEFQGQISWAAVASLVPEQTARSCKTRWVNHIRPTQSKSWSRQEDELLLRKYAELGPKWDKISNFFKNRNEASLNNRYFLLRKNFSSFDLLNCSYRIRLHENGNKKLLCELKETSDNSNSKVQEIALAAIDPNSTKQIYTNSSDWGRASFNLAMDISEIQIIDQAFPDSPEDQEKIDERRLLINDQIIKQTGTSIISNHKVIIYENNH